jgi:hypothetical protein
MVVEKFIQGFHLARAEEGAQDSVLDRPAFRAVIEVFNLDLNGNLDLGPFGHGLKALFKLPHDSS